MAALTDEQRDFLTAWVAVVTDPEFDQDLYRLSMELEMEPEWTV